MSPFKIGQSQAQGNPAATPARKNLFSWTLSCGSHLRFPTAVEDIR